MNAAVPQRPRQLHERIQAAPRDSRAARADLCASHRGLRSTGRVGVVQGLRHRHPGDDTGQKEAQREPCAVAAAGEGNPRPPARDGAWGGAQRRAVHFLFGARRLPQRCAPWACVGAGRAPLSLLVSGTAARLGTEQRQSPSPSRAARSATELVLAAEPQPNCEEGSRLRLLVPSFLSPSLPLSRPGGRPQFQARAGLFCGRGLHLYTNCLSLARVSTSARAQEACFPNPCS